MHSVRILISFLIFFTSLSVQGQSLKAFVKAGDKAAANKDFNAALEYYRSAYELNSSKMEVAYKLAEVARQFYAYDIADEFYTKVGESRSADQFPSLPFHRGEVAYGRGNYAAAIQLYEEYLSGQGGDRQYQEQARKAIENARWALEIVEEPDQVDIQHLNKRVNTPYTEFGSLQRGDSLYYSSMRYEYREDTHDPPRRFSKVLSSVKGSKGRPLPRGFNEKNKHTAHLTFTADGKRIYYTLCEYITDTRINCKILTRDWNTKRKRWNKAQLLSDKINLEGFTATQPNVGIDPASEKEVLYFVSDRPGGAGGMDLWYAEIKTKGKCGTPENLKVLNTSGNEISPFFHRATEGLYFSSDGHQGLGGYDIFYTVQIDKDWESPAHTGYPLNSSYNDVYFSLDAESQLGYLSSNRPGSFYLDKNNKACCNDIYRAIFAPDSLPPPDLPVDSLIIVEEPPEEPPVEEVVIIPPPKEPVPERLEDFLPLALYFHNDEPDKRTRRTTTRKSYSQTFYPYYALKSEYLESYTQPITDTELRISEEIKLDDFFEDKVKKGHDYLLLFSEILLKRLNQEEQVEIFIKGFTSPRAKSDYNLSLGKRRVSSLRNHFDTYADGIFLPFIQSGQLTITERSFGETTSASGISDDLNDKRNSIYSVPAALERRVEIVEIKRG